MAKPVWGADGLRGISGVCGGANLRFVMLNSCQHPSEPVGPGRTYKAKNPPARRARL
jgi:hypothetical protein